MSAQASTSPAAERHVTLYPQLFPNSDTASSNSDTPEVPIQSQFRGSSDRSFHTGEPSVAVSTGNPEFSFSNANPAVSTGIPAESQSAGTEGVVEHSDLWAVSSGATLLNPKVPADVAGTESSQSVRKTTVQSQSSQTAQTDRTILEWRSNVHNPTTVEANNNQGHANIGNHKVHKPHYTGNPFDPDVLPPEKFLKWLSGNDPVENYIEVKQETVTVADDRATSRNLIIVLITVCGTVSICVLGIIIAICYRTRTRSDKLDALSHEPPVGFQVKTSQDVYETGGDYPSIFMGIPANNEIWKDLQNLPSTTSVATPDNPKV